MQSPENSDSQPCSHENKARIFLHKLNRGTTSLLCVLSLIFLASCTPREQAVLVVGTDQAGAMEPREEVEIGDTLTVSLDRLKPGQWVDIYLNDDLGQEWSFARVQANPAGEIEPFVFWYHTGVIGTTSLEVDFKPDPAFVAFEEAEAFFAAHALELRVLDQDGKLLTRQSLRVGRRQSPTIYPSNADGVLVNAFNALSDRVFVTGRNFSPGSTVHVALVNNQFQWHEGDLIRDVSGQGGIPNAKTITLAPGQTDFTIPISGVADTQVGAFDFIARIDRSFADLRFHADDILSYNEDTAMLKFVIINGNVVIDVAGRMRGAPAKFEFSDSFEKAQNVYGAVDPTDVPSGHTGGNYAAYYIVDDQNAAYWDGVNPPVIDVSGGHEIHRVKYWCINASRRLIWPGATQAEPIKGYDVIVDFGDVPAMVAADFVADGEYDKGLDFIDGYDGVGFYVFEDPSSIGTFPVATVDHLDENGIIGIPTDPAGILGPTYDIDLAWARIMYPGTAAGTGVPVNPDETSYPVALFLHGRHAWCDSNGAAPGGSSVFSPPPSCPIANRIPSHRGYDYIMERLASQGIISISIDAFEIQLDNGAWNYQARGLLVLKWLDILRDWNDNGTDPFGGIFQGKIDMSRIALSGHSRGGEGVVAAQQLNLAWPIPHSILAVNAIAPTDQNSLNGISFLMTTAPYYLVLGARDGDVSNMQGMRTYDRAYPQGASGRQVKSLATVYGANHNYFNTIWTDATALGEPNPWTGAGDDAGFISSGFALTAAAQRQVALTTITAFFRWHLQGLDPYKEIFTGRLKPALMDNNNVYWTYQDKVRIAVDDFEQRPNNAAQNSLLGAVSGPAFTLLDEFHFNQSGSDYTTAPPLPTQDSQFYHDTLGLKLTWVGPGTYETLLPGGLDVSGFTHLTLRVAKKVSGAPTTGPDVNLFVNIEDGLMNGALWDLRTDQFDRIPHPFERSSSSNQALLTGVRIPLRNFTMNNSGVDLTDIRKITIRTEGSGTIGIDDIEFGH